MRSALASLAAVVSLAAPSVALARPVTLGVSAGTIQSEDDTDSEAEGVLDMFGRIGLTGRLSAQLDVSKFEMSQNDISVRSATALAVVDLGALGRRGRLVPLVFAGIGIDRATDTYGAGEDGTHAEAGVGLELRLDGGLVIAADARIGGRDGEEPSTVVYNDTPGIAAYYLPIMPEGQYRSVRVGVGVRF